MIKDRLNEIVQEKLADVFYGFPLKGYTTINIGGNASVLIRPGTVSSLAEVLKKLSGDKIKVIGRGSNILFPDQGTDSVIITLEAEGFKAIEIQGDTVKVGSGALLSNIISWCAYKGLSGFEGLIGIPATVGGAIKMNASYRSAISDNLVKVLVLTPEGTQKWLSKSDIDFGYRFSAISDDLVIIEALFSVQKKEPDQIKGNMQEFFMEKLSKQPLGKKTLGCIFKNPRGSSLSSGELIEKAGLKGFKRGSARVSAKHANFIENDGGATSSDVLSVMEHIKTEVYKKFSIELESEIEIL